MTTTISNETRLTVVKHLAAGKTPDVVAAITRLPRGDVVDIGNHHGYPDTAKLAWAADVLAKNAEVARKAEVPEGTAAPLPRIPRPATTSPSSITVANARQVGAPDEIRVLLNTAKSHPAKRVNAAADRVFDALDRLRSLLAEDEKKHAARREAEAQRVAAKAEVERLTKALAEAKAKMRGGTTSLDVDSSVSAAELRAWAKANGVECPAVGRVPATVREQYAAEQDRAAS